MVALKQKGLLGQSKTFSGTVGSSSCVVQGELWRQSIRSRARLLRPVSFYSSTRDDPSLKRSFILRTVHSRTDRPNRHLINLLARTRRPEAARAAHCKALALTPNSAERSAATSGFTRTRTRALASGIFSRRNISARKVSNLSSRMGSSVPSRSCPPLTPREAWPALSC